MNRVLARSTLASIARTCAGSVESSTCRGSRISWQTSPPALGPRLEPPMPSTTASVNLSLHAARNPRSRPHRPGRAVQPAQPFVLIVAGPDRFVLLPERRILAEARHSSVLLSIVLSRSPPSLSCWRSMLPPSDVALVGDRAVKLVGSVRKQLDAVLTSSAVIASSEMPISRARRARARILDIFLEAVAHLP